MFRTFVEDRSQDMQNEEYMNIYFYNWEWRR